MSRNITDYEYIAASQTDQVMGPVGNQGDILMRLVVTPVTTSPGAVVIEDGSETARTVFTGGASSVADLTPIVIELGIRARSTGWEITTGANVTVIAVGSFS